MSLSKNYLIWLESWNFKWNQLFTKKVHVFLGIGNKTENGSYFSYFFQIFLQFLAQQSVQILCFCRNSRLWIWASFRSRTLQKNISLRKSKIILKIESRTWMYTIQGGEKSEYEKRIKMLSKMNKFSRCITFFNA